MRQFLGAVASVCALVSGCLMSARVRGHAAVVMAAMLVGWMSPLTALAATTSYMLNQSNTTPPFADGTNYLQLTIMDGADAAGQLLGGYTTTSSDVLFRVDILSALTAYQGFEFGLDQFAFNTVLATLPKASNFVLPANWSLANPGNADGFGKFELRADTNGSANRVSMLSFAIKNYSGDSVLSYFELSSGNAGQGNYAYAAHVAGLVAPGGVTSAWFAGPLVAVPLPASLPLLLSALSAFLGLRRRPAIGVAAC
jgi:hypothetical protein